ncbi:MAG: enolase C-terminal domain-like protein [Burkholderiales bacterium]
MKIRSVHAFAIRSDLIGGPARTPARRPAWVDQAEVANPMSHYPRFKRLRSSWRPRWPSVACIVTAEDGQWGLGMTRYGSPVIAIINEHLAPLLAGESCEDISALWQMLQRLTSPYAGGLSCYAISAIDLALWDLRGRHERRPVHRLLGSGTRTDIPVYATGNDPDWFLELGFEALKIACPYGPADGAAGLDANEALLREVRALAGPQRDLMVDCWMAFDLPYALEFASRVRPLGLRWIEDCLMPEDFDGLAALRTGTPGQALAGGEHWYTPEPFARALRAGSLDVLQPDIGWACGLTGCLRIADLARAAGKPVILHAGMNTAYGQHFSLAVPDVPLGEYFVGSAPGVPLAEVRLSPGTPVPVKGRLTPSDEPGFGLGLSLDAARALAI